MDDQEQLEHQIDTSKYQHLDVMAKPDSGTSGAEQLIAELEEVSDDEDIPLVLFD